MNQNTKKIKQIADRGIVPTLKNAGFHRRGSDFSRNYGEALQVVNLQLSSGNTKELGRFTLNIGVHFNRVAALLFGKDPMPVNPKESSCLLRARVGLLMPEQNDHWWSVTPETNGEAVSKELAAVCSSYVLPWLEHFKSVAETDWKPRRGMIQHPCAEAAANLVLGKTERAARCIEEELARIHHDPAYRDQNNAWRDEQISQIKKWAAENGIAA